MPRRPRNPDRRKRIRSPAVGWRITSLRCEDESGHVVARLENGDELWISAPRDEALSDGAADLRPERPAR